MPDECWNETCSCVHAERAFGLSRTAKLRSPARGSQLPACHWRVSRSIPGGCNHPKQAWEKPGRAWCAGAGCMMWGPPGASVVKLLQSFGEDHHLVASAPEGLHHRRLLKATLKAKHRPKLVTTVRRRTTKQVDSAPCPI